MLLFKFLIFIFLSYCKTPNFEDFSVNINGILKFKNKNYIFIQARYLYYDLPWNGKMYDTKVKRYKTLKQTGKKP